MCRRRHERDEIPSSLAEIFIFTDKLALKRLWQKSATILMQSVTEIINNLKFEKQTSCVLQRVIHDLKAQMVYASLPNRNDYRRKVYHYKVNGKLREKGDVINTNSQSYLKSQFSFRQNKVFLYSFRMALFMTP